MSVMQSFFATVASLDVRRQNRVLLGIVLLQVLAYLVAGALVNGRGPLAVPQPDTLLFYQAARRIAEGHAFSFSAGTAVSTGTTSVLMPFVLAVPYALGFTGESLTLAGFALNAVFYALFVLCWAKAFRARLPAGTAFYASLLLALLPVTACVAFQQSDQGLWMAVSAGCALGLATGRRGLYAPLLCLGPWVRPEGMIVVVVFTLSLAFVRRKGDVLIAVLALASVAGVFALNWGLTGVAGFSSTAQKGYFTRLPFTGACLKTFQDGITICRELFLGQAGGGIRAAVGVPVLGGLAWLAGLALHRWDVRRDRFLGIFLVAAAGGVFVVASSGWQGSNTDRYLAWLMPLLTLFCALGWHAAYTRLRGHSASVAVLLLPIAFALAGGGFFLAYFNANCEGVNRTVKFARDVARMLPAESSVGNAGILPYLLGDRRCVYFSGIYSPEMETQDLSGNCVWEIFKHERSTRFDYWVTEGSGAIPSGLHEAGEQTVLSTLAGDMKLVRADWRRLDAALAPPVVTNGAGRALVVKDAVDVGYERDERRVRWREKRPRATRPFKPVMVAGALRGTNIFEVGRVVNGRSEMSVRNLTPGADVVVALRTAKKVSASWVNTFGDDHNCDIAFRENLPLRVLVDGRPAADCRLHLSTNMLSEVTMTIPGRFVTRPEHRIAFQGDHVALGYWFFQE